MPRAEFQNFDSSTGTVRVVSDPTRRWTHIVGQLRRRASKLRRADSIAPSLQEVLVDELVVTCTSLLQELGGLDLEVQSRRAEAQYERERANYLFERMAAACVSTDDAGRILAANQAAARLLNVSARHLKDRLLLHFAQDRSAFTAVLRGLPGQVDGIETTLTMRPRERAATSLRATVVPDRAVTTARWFWFFAPTDSSIGSATGRVPSDDASSRPLQTGANPY
jgi:PAS domain-containing protein